MTPTIHIGSSIRAELTRQQKTMVWLADQLGTARPNAYRIVRASSLQTDSLFRISKILDHDFFAEYSARFAIDKTKNNHKNKQ